MAITAGSETSIYSKELEPGVLSQVSFIAPTQTAGVVVATISVVCDGNLEVVLGSDIPIGLTESFTWAGQISVKVAKRYRLHARLTSTENERQPFDFGWGWTE